MDSETNGKEKTNRVPLVKIDTIQQHDQIIQYEDIPDSYIREDSLIISASKERSKNQNSKVNIQNGEDSIYTDHDIINCDIFNNNKISVDNGKIWTAKDEINFNKKPNNDKT